MFEGLFQPTHLISAETPAGACSARALYAGSEEA